jgi:hypothetical protein
MDKVILYEYNISAFFDLSRTCINHWQLCTKSDMPFKLSLLSLRLSIPGFADDRYSRLLVSSICTQAKKVINLQREEDTITG